MKIMNYKLKNISIAILVVSIFAFPIQAADKHGGPGATETQSKLWLVGSSSLHAYSSTAHNIKADFGFVPGSLPIDQLKAGQLRSFELTVPVKDMRSGKNQLDKNLQKALKADEVPHILFHLGTYEVMPSTTPTQGLAVKVKGILEIAGVKKDVMLEGTLTKEESGARIQGVKDLLMTDYGVKPPKILLIKTANEVRVHYDLWLNEKGEVK